MNPPLQNESSQRRAAFDYSQLTFRRARPADRDAVEALRIGAYRKARNTLLMDETPLRWNEVEDQHLCVVLESPTGIVATSRAIKILGPIPFLEWTNIYASPSVYFPTLYIKNSATHEDFQGLGLNLVLKIMLVRLCIGTPMACIANPINVGTGRIQRLESMGFRFENPLLQERNITNSPFFFKTPLSLGVLYQKDFPRFVEAREVGLLGVASRLKYDPISLAEIGNYLSDQ